MYSHTYPKIFFRFISLIILVISGKVLFAQDTTKTYKLKEITVSGSELINPKPVSLLKYDLITKSDAKSVAEVSKFIPSLKLQVNSRGESQIFLRGYGVRQLALFFDGTPMPVPWDNRIDLSLVPTNALNSISISGGTPSVLFGAKTMGGLIALESFIPSAANKIKNVYYVFGSNDSHELKLNYSGISGLFSYVFSFGYEKSGEYKLPANTSDFYSGKDIRLNTDHQRFNGFVKIIQKFSEFSQLSLSASIVDAEKGVAPEYNVKKPRFWRYPLWRKLTLILNGKHQLFNTFHTLDYAVSLSGFKMKINQYTDATFSELDDVENNNDIVLYGRALYTGFLSYSSVLKISASNLNSVHVENFLTDPDDKIYSQNVFSFGTEYEYHTLKNTFLAGAGLDWQTTPETGGKIKRQAESKINFKTGLTHYFTDDFSTQLIFGKKSRFPTLRELYSGALGRFVPNPGLKSEDVYNFETNFSYAFLNNEIKISLFYSLLSNGIERITLPGKQFKRVNKDKIRTWGTELALQLNPEKELNVNLNISYLNSFAKNEKGKFADTLEYKPRLIANAQIDYKFIKNFDFVFEANFIGEEYGLKEGSIYFQKLPSYLIVNSRVSYNFFLNKSMPMEIFFRVNNLLDKLYFTQWGLPEKGRELLMGLKIKF